MTPLDSGQQALLELLEALKSGCYQFVTVTPESHKRVLAREPGRTAETVRDVFGWSLPFRPDGLDARLIALLRAAEALEALEGGLFKSRVRVSSLDDLLFLHSAYPTEDEDAVFFGPDSYRFAAFLADTLEEVGSGTLVDIGAGSGVGGVVVARHRGQITPILTDINRRALRLAAVNARFAGVEPILCEGSGLDGVKRPFDIAITNPPFIIDPHNRAYRDGGDMHGARLSFDWTLAAARAVNPGGHVLLYTGSAIVGGRDALREALEEALPAFGCTLRYRELDPDIFGEELSLPEYADVERIAAVGAVIAKAA
ncbi:methyltransferase [Allosphingosinicella vermicomposti]|uniref:methyltransferase n=1 Tax=Allosphingosinicella vermicomposti TaxID=614671 RepID=UPI000D0F469E|nr:methyltransferase [Allosphingosinicella vermicomposti]